MPKRLRNALLVGFVPLWVGVSGCAAGKKPPDPPPEDNSPREEETAAIYPEDEPSRKLDQLDHQLDEQTRKLEVHQLFTRGLAYESLGEYSRAIDAYREVRERAARTSGREGLAPRAQLRIARIYRNHMDNPSRAETEYRTFLEQYPDHPHHGKALVELGRMYQEQGQHDAAVEVFESFVRRYPSSDSLQGVYYNLGVIHLNQNQPAKAVDAFEKMLSSFPEGDLVDGALFRVGQAHNKLGHTEAQLEAFTRLLQDHPESDLREFVMYRTVHLALELDKNELARRWVNRYQKEYPEGRYRAELEKLTPSESS